MSPRPVRPEARTVCFDVSEAPDAYYVSTFDADGQILDLIESFDDGDKAEAFAKQLAQRHGLPLRVQTEL